MQLHRLGAVFEQPAKRLQAQIAVRFTNQAGDDDG
jgi:hypothetical protein